MCNIQNGFWAHRATLLSICMVVVFFGLALQVYATGGTTMFTNPLGNITLEGFLLKIIDAVIIILFPILVLMIVYTGFLFVKAQGKPEEIKRANEALMWTVVGGGVVLGAKALAAVISSTVTTISGSLT